MMMNRILPIALLMTALLASAPAEARKRLVFEETVIEGEIQKHEVAVYITRQNLNKAYDLELKESFLLKIVDALEKTPF